MLVATLLFFQHIAVQDLPLVDKNPYTTVADIEQGRRLYAGRCAGCHGPTGDGGKGSNLAVPSLPRGQTDLALYKVIRYGLPETEMPAHNMTQREIWQLAAWVRTLGRSDTAPVSGDPGKGEALVRGSGGCLGCHVLNGQGGHLGPALTDIGQRRSPSWIRIKLLKPDLGPEANPRVATLTTRSGQKVNGIVLNEDTWSIQLRDTGTRLHSFWKQDLASLSVERRSLMPSYSARLKEQELNDIVAFLVSTGRQQ